VTVLEMIGYGGWLHGHLEDCSEAWTEMRRMAHEKGWISREAEALSLLSRIPFYTNDLPKALQMLDEAHALAKQGTSRLSRARVDKAYAIRIEMSGSPTGGDADAEALDLLREVAAVLEEFGDRIELNIVEVHLGDIKRRQGRFDEALEYYERALANVMDHVGYRPETQRRIAQVLVELGQAERAAEHAEEAVSIVAPDDVFTVASASMALGQVREAQGRLDEAEALLRKAVETVEATDYQPGEMQFQLAAFLYRRGRADEAAQYAEQARQSVRKLGPESPRIAFVEQQISAVIESARSGRC
jgi:tetratricopeptide (TPR) repeat protein